MLWRCAGFVQRGSRLKRRLPRPDHSDVRPLEGGEAGNPGCVSGKSWRQGCYRRRNVGEVCQAGRDYHAVCDKVLAVGERDRKATSLSCYLRDVNWLDPRHIRLLEPMPIGGEIAD